MIGSMFDVFVLAVGQNEEYHPQNRIKQFLGNSYDEYEKQQERQRVVDAIEKLDFSMMKMKIQLPVEQEGLGWDKETTLMAEMLYKGFLKLTILYPNTTIVPNKLIDEFWHKHILDTLKYDQDCQQVLGYFLHHYPYFGLRGEQDAKNLKDSYAHTCALFQKEFGIDITVSPRMDCRGDSKCTNDEAGAVCIVCGSHK